jgi:ABC-type proline/glycine betaine transport system substrate-binding protein
MLWYRFKDITAVLRDIKPALEECGSRLISCKSGWNCNDSTTALLKFLALQSNQASSNKTIKMVHRILRCVRRYSKQELVVVLLMSKWFMKKGEEEDEEYA